MQVFKAENLARIACAFLGLMWAFNAGAQCLTFDADTSLSDGPEWSQMEVLIDEAPVVRCVVHVLYHDSVPNSQLDDSVVTGAMENLNEVFASYGVQFNLFQLLKHDVTTRFYGNGFYTGQMCPTQHIGILNAYAAPFYWDTDTYCNIYVTPFACGSILGWAFTSPNENEADGIWVLTGAFGVEGAHLIPDRNLNATLIHEMGHYLGLHHIFKGIDYCGQAESDCEAENDYVCDTPRVKASESCLNPTCPTGLYGYEANNYMDYVPDSCMNTFTPGQSQRMMNQLLNGRNSVLMIECPSDLNNDYIVGTLDLLIILEGLGNGTHSVIDLVQLLGRYGNLCN